MKFSMNVKYEIRKKNSACVLSPGISTCLAAKSISAKPEASAVIR